jgi:hypothetical protein
MKKSFASGYITHQADEGSTGENTDFTAHTIDQQTESNLTNNVTNKHSVANSGRRQRVVGASIDLTEERADSTDGVGLVTVTSKGNTSEDQRGGLGNLFFGSGGVNSVGSVLVVNDIKASLLLRSNDRKVLGDIASRHLERLC